jgi:hypothetical protein
VGAPPSQRGWTSAESSERINRLRGTLGQGEHRVRVPCSARTERSPELLLIILCEIQRFNLSLTSWSVLLINVDLGAYRLEFPIMICRGDSRPIQIAPLLSRVRLGL